MSDKISRITTKTTSTPHAAGLGISVTAGGTATTLFGMYVVLNMEVKDDGNVAAYKIMVDGLPIPNRTPEVFGVDTSGNVYPGYISASGQLVTRRAYTSGVYVRYNCTYLI